MKKHVAALLLLFSILSPAVAFAHGMSEADKLLAANAGFVEFMYLGATHMITGYDHLLFLFGVIFFLTKFKDIVKFITAFTIGHCITLIFATFLGIQANYFLIDAVIALTVCYKGFDNVDGFRRYFDMKSPNLLGMVFIFGLIHGFGLSTRLQTLTIGEGWDLFGKIIAFNIGVEFGQIAALAIMLVLLSVWRHTASFKRFSNASNVGLIIVGGLLFLMQLHGYQHESDPDGFGFPEETHAHLHEDMAFAGTGSHSHGASSIPDGWHVDPGDSLAHPDLIDTIFETRKAYKSASSDAEILEVHHPVEEIYAHLVTLRGQVADRLTIDLDQYDAFLADAETAMYGINAESHDGNIDKTREYIAQFDKSVLGIEELVMGAIEATAEASHTHAGEAGPYHDLIDEIFEIRKQYRRAESDAEVLEVHHPIDEIQHRLVALRKIVVDEGKVSLSDIDPYFTMATEASQGINAESHNGSVEKTREHLAAFEKAVLGVEGILMNVPVEGAAMDLPPGWHIDPGDTVPHSHDPNAELPPGWHIDPGSSIPHRDHGDEADHTHAGESGPYHELIDKIFNTRKGYKAVKTDEELLEVHHPVDEVQEYMVALRKVVVDQGKVNLADIDPFFTMSTEAATGIHDESHDGSLTKTRDYLAQFDKGVLGVEAILMNVPVDGAKMDLPPGWHIDPGDTVPHTHDPNAELPPGWHIDPGSSIPHRDHGDEADHTHAGESGPYHTLIDKIFNTRKGYKTVKTDEELLEVHHPVDEVQEYMVALRKIVVDEGKVNLADIDSFFTMSTEAATGIHDESHDGSLTKTRDYLAQFDKGVLGVEAILMNVPVEGAEVELPPGWHIDPGSDVAHSHDPNAELPEGWHFDEGSKIPHRDH
jgi:hypothetical protein